MARRRDNGQLINASGPEGLRELLIRDYGTNRCRARSRHDRPAVPRELRMHMQAEALRRAFPGWAIAVQAWPGHRCIEAVNQDGGGLYRSSAPTRLIFERVARFMTSARARLTRCGVGSRLPGRPRPQITTMCAPSGRFGRWDVRRGLHRVRYAVAASRHRLQVQGTHPRDLRQPGHNDPVVASTRARAHRPGRKPPGGRGGDHGQDHDR